MNLFPVNTALKGSRYFEYEKRGELAETEFYANERGVVFQHDMCAPFSVRERQLCERAQCICSVLSWAHGYRTFAARAGVKQTGTHGAYLEAVRWYLEERVIPSFIVCTKKDVLWLGPHAVQPIKLLGTDALLAVWNAEPLLKVPDAAELPQALAARYKSVYDFSCGYGNSLRPFKYFIGSDIDRKCLNYIERQILCSEVATSKLQMQTIKEMKMVPVNRIKPYHRNVRQNERTVEQLVAIIPKVGFNVPLVLDKQNVIVKGHARWAAAIKLGMKAVPVVYTDADEETIKLDRLTDNKIQELTEWDEEQLASEIASLTLGYEIDLAAIGFASTSLESLLPGMPGPDVGADHALPGDDNPDNYEKCICDKCGNVMFIKLA